MLARFVPVVRTFVPVVAGVSNMRYRTFVTFNVVGAFLWAIGVTLLGYYLGQVDSMEANLELAILTVVHLGASDRPRGVAVTAGGAPEAPAMQPEVDRTGA